MKTFLINLNRSRERLQLAHDQLSQAGLAYERIEAVDGTILDEASIQGLDQTKAIKTFKHPLRSGEIGCYLSHIRAVERIIALDLPYALVLEDDFSFTPSSLTILSQLEQKLCADLIKDWDVINLGNTVKKIYRILPEVKFNHADANLCRAFYFPITTTGLIWSKAGAHRFLQQASHIYEPVDGTLQRLMCASGRGLAFQQRLLATNGSASVINLESIQEAVMQDANIVLRAKRYVEAMQRFLRGPSIF